MNSPVFAEFKQKWLQPGGRHHVVPEMVPVGVKQSGHSSPKKQWKTLTEYSRLSLKAGSQQQVFQGRILCLCHWGKVFFSDIYKTVDDLCIKYF